MLRYGGASLSHAEADAWLALLMYRDRVGRVEADSQAQSSIQGITVVLTRLGLKPFTGHYEPLYLALEQYMREPGKPTSSDLLQAVHSGARSLVPGTDPSPSIPYASSYLSLRGHLTRIELQHLHSLWDHVVNVALLTRQPLFVTIMLQLRDATSILPLPRGPGPQATSFQPPDLLTEEA